MKPTAGKKLSAAEAGTTLTAHRIDLINKDNTRAVTFSFLKKITDTGSTNTDKHFHKIRS